MLIFDLPSFLLHFYLRDQYSRYLSHEAGRPGALRSSREKSAYVAARQTCVAILCRHVAGAYEI